MGNSPSPSTAEEEEEEFEFERCDSGNCTKLRSVDESSQNYTHSNYNQPKCAADGVVQMWENGIIPYEINPSLDFNKERILRAMRAIENYSRMRFVERSNQNTFLKITKLNGCYFFRNGFGHPKLSLGIGCEDYGTVLHELMHAIGFEHEHMRPDRDKYITIHWENIKEGGESQFRKLKANEYEWSEFPFDYQSIMLYHEYAFSKNGEKTIEAKNGRTIYKNKDLSKLDKEKLRKL